MRKPLLPIPILLVFGFLMAVNVIPDTVATATEIPGAEKPDCSKFTQGELPSPRILLLGPTGKAYCSRQNKERIHKIEI